MAYFRSSARTGLSLPKEQGNHGVWSYIKSKGYTQTSPQNEADPAPCDKLYELKGKSVSFMAKVRNYTIYTRATLNTFKEHIVAVTPAACFVETAKSSLYAVKEVAKGAIVLKGKGKKIKEPDMRACYLPLTAELVSRLQNQAFRDNFIVDTEGKLWQLTRGMPEHNEWCRQFA